MYLGMTVVSAPITTDKTVMIARASIAAAKTVKREYFMAMIAAMKNVLSPISETKMTEIEERKP